MQYTLLWKNYINRIIQGQQVRRGCRCSIKHLLVKHFSPKVFLGRGLSRHALSKPVVCIWSYNQNFFKKKILLLAAKRKSWITFNERLECGNQKNRVDGLEREISWGGCCGARWDFSAAVCTGCTGRSSLRWAGACSLSWPALTIARRTAPCLWTSQPLELEEFFFLPRDKVSQ